MFNNEQPLFEEYVGKSLEGCLRSLAGKRPVFHSEADFQFALTQEIEETWRKIGKRKERRGSCIRLEYPFRTTFDDERDKYVDIVIILDDSSLDGSRMIPIELKYKTAELSCDVSAGSKNEEEFNLRNHSAHDLAMYDCLKDIERIEKLLNDDNVDAKEGYTIWLTNDMYYPNGPKDYFETKEKERPKTNADAFRIHSNTENPCEIKGDLSWRWWKDKDKEKKQELEKKYGGIAVEGRGPLNLSGAYTITWNDYAYDEATDPVYILNPSGKTQFKYAITHVTTPKTDGCI